MSTYNNDLSYSKCKAERERERHSKKANTKVSCEFSQESIISCPDVITLPMIIQTEIKME
jgi:hypothetical protein